MKLQNSPAIDTGGVCRQLFSAVLNDVASNKYVRLFDGSSHSLRPICTAESRNCGLFKVLGKMIGHSMCIDGIGFPYLSFLSDDVCIDMFQRCGITTLLSVCLSQSNNCTCL